MERSGGGRGGPQVIPVRIQEYLSGVEYPATKDQLVAHAQEHGAPQEVIDFMKRLPRRSYKSPTEVSQEAGKLT
jgi:hypothetical protein